MVKNLKITLTLCCVCFSFVLILARAGYTALADPEEAAGFIPKNPDSMDISVPELPSLAIFLDGVFDTYEYFPAYDGAREGGDPHVSSPPTYKIYVQEDAAVSFNQAFTIRLAQGPRYEAIDLPQNELAYMEKGSEVILFVYEDGTFVSEEFATSPIGLQISIIAWNEDDEQLALGELLPIQNLRLDEVYLPEPPPGVWLTHPKTVSATVDGKETGFFAYPIDDEDYFMLRDLAFAFTGTQAAFDVQWNAEAGAIELSRGKTYTPAGVEMQLADKGEKQTSDAYMDILLDDAVLTLLGYNIDGHYYFKMEDLAATLDFGVFWDDNPEHPLIQIDTPMSYWLPLRGYSDVAGEDVVWVTLGIHANHGSWEYTASEEGIVRELDSIEYMDNQFQEWLEAVEQAEEGEEVPEMPEDAIPGTKPFLFAGEKPGVVELRFTHVDRDPETGPGPEIKAACRIQVFDDQTLAVIGRNDGNYGNEKE